MIDNETAKRLYQRILLSRLRILNKYPFYGLLLMHIKFGLSIKTETTTITNEMLQFNPEYLESINDMELDLVMIHNILHLALDHVNRSKDFPNKEAYQKATDLIVNSNIYDSLRRAGATNMMAIMDSDEFNMPHKYETKKVHEEAIKYDVESLYNKLLLLVGPKGKSSKGKGQDGDSESQSVSGGDSDDEEDENNSSNGSSGSGQNQSQNGKRLVGGDQRGKPIDDHSSWDDQGQDANSRMKTAMWRQRMMSAAESLQVSKSKTAGNMPLGIERVIEELKKPQHNWREILQDFIQEDINVYSFNPPDRRFDDTGFYLPDYNEKDEKAKNILFMIDTSGSMSDIQIMEMYAEVKGAIDQFDGHLEGKLGFFDSEVVPPIPFCNEDEFKVIKPYGGGGTSFLAIFDYVKEQMQDDPPESIIIMTDGYAPFPREFQVPSIPLLWIINNKEVDPPYGRVIRIESEDDDYDY